MSPRSLPPIGSRLALDEALKRHWKNMTGVAVFPPWFLIGAGVFKEPGLPFIPLFLAVSLWVAWPCYTSTAPEMFWIFAIGVWMAGAFVSVMLPGLPALFGIKAEG